MSEYVATIATADLTQRFDVTAYLSMGFAGVVRHLAGGEWEAPLPVSVWSKIVERFPEQDEAPLLFDLRWADSRKGVLLSGPIQHATFARKGATETLTLTGIDDWGAVLGSRLVWPQQANPPWNTSAYHEITAQASSAVAELVTQHVGSGALPARQRPGLTVVDQGAGATRTWQYRLSALESAVADIANAEDLRVDVRRELNGELTVTVGPTQNRTNIVVNEAKLADFSVTLSIGDATTVVAGGSGEGTSRLFALAGGTVAGAARREVFSDQRNIASQPTLDAAAAAQRSAGSSSSSLSGTLLPGVPVVWRDDYELGDLLTLQVEGTRWPAQVTAVTVQIDENGLHVSPVLGKASRFALTQLLRDVSGLGSRLSTLEVS